MLGKIAAAAQIAIGSTDKARSTADAIAAGTGVAAAKGKTIQRTDRGIFPDGGSIGHDGSCRLLPCRRSLQCVPVIVIVSRIGIVGSDRAVIVPAVGIGIAVGVGVIAVSIVVGMGRYRH